MPIKIPSKLPAMQILQREGVIVIEEGDAIRQDIRPLRIALLNLMPEKIKTETQIARVLGATPLQVEIILLKLGTHKSKTTPEQHLLDFYHSWETVHDERFDGMIVTGAPIEKLPFEEVSYWQELVDIFEWSRGHVHGLFNLCWGAQAALYHFYGIPKYLLPEKRFGVFRHRVLNTGSLLMRGLNDEFPVPVSRHTENRSDDFKDFDQLEILLESSDAGVCLVYDHQRRHVHMFNHLEYDSTTLDDEYRRDIVAGDAIGVPRSYYPEDDPGKAPVNTWRSHGHILYSNWINLLYQTAPYDIDRIGTDVDD
jgi:homoserine O-succinyltransferase